MLSVGVRVSTHRRLIKLTSSAGEEWFACWPQAAITDCAAAPRLVELVQAALQDGVKLFKAKLGFVVFFGV